MAMPAFISKLFPNKMTFLAFLDQLKTNDVFWISAQINTDQKMTLLNKKFDLVTHKHTHQLRMVSQETHFNVDYYLDERFQTGNNIHQTSKEVLLFNQKWDAIVEEQIEKIKYIFDNTIDDSTSPRDIEENEKALEWIRVSFLVLEKAIKESLTNPELLFQLQLFLGRNPKTNLTEIRAIIFNLDIKLVVLESGILHVSVYDDKNQELGTSKKPALIGNFSSRRKEIFDEFIKIMAIFSIGIKLN